MKIFEKIPETWRDIRMKFNRKMQLGKLNKLKDKLIGEDKKKPQYMFTKVQLRLIAVVFGLAVLIAIIGTAYPNAKIVKILAICAIVLAAIIVIPNIWEFIWSLMQLVWVLKQLIKGKTNFHKAITKIYKNFKKGGWLLSREQKKRLKNALKESIKNKDWSSDEEKIIQWPTLDSFIEYGAALVSGQPTDEIMKKAQSLWIDKLLPEHWEILFNALSDESYLKRAADIVSSIRNGKYCPAPSKIMKGGEPARESILIKVLKAIGELGSADMLEKLKKLKTQEKNQELQSWYNYAVDKIKSNSL